MIYLYKRFKFFIQKFFYSIKNEKLHQTLGKLKKTLLNQNKIDLDILKDEFKNESLDDLFLRFGTDKGMYDGKKTFYMMKNDQSFKNKFQNYNQWILRKDLHNYEYQLGLNFTPFYEKHFSDIKNKNLNILEIGVANGHSFAAFFNYFSNSNFYGIDMKDKYKLFYRSKKYKYFKLNILSNKEIIEFKKKNINFDIIIDDSLHDQNGITNNIKNFYPLLKKNGFYVIEDFKLDDQIVAEIRNFNLKKNNKMFFFTQLTCHEIFKNINDKIYFDHTILNKKILNDIYSFDNIVNIYYNESPFSSLCFINKK